MGTAIPHGDLQLECILSKSRRGECLTRREIRFLLALGDQGGLDRLFQTAPEVRQIQSHGQAITRKSG